MYVELIPSSRRVKPTTGMLLAVTDVSKNGILRLRRENRGRHGHIAIRTEISLRCFVQVVILMEWLTDRLIQVGRSIQV